MTGRDVALLARPAVHLRPGQIAQRARLRTQRTALRRFPPAARWLLSGPDPATAVGWPAGFSPLDARLRRDRPDLPDLRDGRLELLGMGRTLIRPAHRGPARGGMGGFPDAGPAPEHRAQSAWKQADWEQADAPALWRFHLHYWDWSPGPVRNYERSTAAHNTVEVDGTDSTEVWGAFRAARRVRVSEVSARADAGVLTVEAVHDGFRRLQGRPEHRRRWSLSETRLRVDDLIGGSGDHAMTVHWHLMPESVVRPTAWGAVVSTSAGEFRVAVSASGPVTLTAGSAPVAIGFGRTVDAPVLTCHIQAVVPVQISTVWRCARNAQPTAAGESAFASEGTA